MKKLHEDKKSKEALKAVREVASKFGIPTTRWAVRRWDKNMAEKKKIMKLKKKLETELADISRRLR